MSNEALRERMVLAMMEEWGVDDVPQTPSWLERARQQGERWADVAMRVIGQEAPMAERTDDA